MGALRKQASPELHHDFRLTNVKKELSIDNPDEEVLRIRGFANTVSKDRAGDVIPRETWEKAGAMDNYLKNPIILFNHDYNQPIGKMVDYEVTDFGLEIEVIISKGADPRLYKLISDGTLQTFSVSFRINDAKYVSENDTYYILDVEMLEISVVSVPCNQNSTFSVVKSLAAGYNEKEFRESISNSGSTGSPEGLLTFEQRLKLLKIINTTRRS